MTMKYLGVVDGSTSGTASAEFRQVNDGGGAISRVSKRATQSHYILADTSDSQDAVLQQASIPTFSTTADATYGFLIAKTAREISTVVLAGVTKILWLVECQFSTEGFSFTKRRWYTEMENELRYLDEASPQVPIATSNDEPLNPEWPVANIILEIEQLQIGAFDPDIIFNYINHTNQYTFYGAAPGTALMQDIKVEESFEHAWLSSEADPCNDIVAHITWTIKFRIRKENGVIVPDTLKLVKLLNEGYMVLPGNAGGPTSTIAAMHPERNGQAPRCNIVASGTYEGMDLRQAQLFDSSLDINDCFVTFTKFPYADFSTLGLEVCATGVAFTSTTTTTT